MLTAGRRGQFPRWRRNKKSLSVCSVLRCRDLWLQCSVSFVQGLEKTHHAFPAATPSWKLAPRPRSKHEKRTAGSAWETRTVAAANGVRCARVRWEINFLLTFETAQLFCVYPVYCIISLTVPCFFVLLSALCLFVSWFLLKERTCLFLSFVTSISIDGLQKTKKLYISLFYFLILCLFSTFFLQSRLLFLYM